MIFCVDVKSVQEIVELKSALEKVMEERPKIQGFSAPQLKLNKRAFVIRRKGVITFMANPRVLWKFGHIKSNEGCENIKGRYVVKRPFIMQVEYMDDSGNTVRKTVLYKKARIICHEIDHLNNITIRDVGKIWWGSKYVRE